MKINRILDNVFSTKSNIAVLRALKNTVIGLSGREVSRHAGLSPKSAIIALNSLENLGIINKISGGREHTFSINREHYLVKEGILFILEVEAKFLESVLKDVKVSLKNKCSSVILYGSVARKEETELSDFDICIVYSAANKRTEIENSVDQLRRKLYKKYGVNISPYYISISEFKKKAKQLKPPVADILREGIIISGDSIRKLLDG